MALFELENSSLRSIRPISFEEAGVREREHLQHALVGKIDALLDGVMVICDEQNLWADANRRVDILCLDRNANLVIIELKRDEYGATAELQAVRYTAMLSTMTFSELCETHSRYRQSKGFEFSIEDAEAAIRQFLAWDDEGDAEQFNSDPRIVLVSRDFSKELTSTVLWLNSRGLDITCIRMVAYSNDRQLLLDIQKVIPVPEVEDYQIKLRRREEEKADARRSKKDYTRYLWKGSIYWKNQLAHAIIHDWVSGNSPVLAEEIWRVFPMQETLSWMIETKERADEVERRDGRPRHYSAEDEVLRLGDGTVYCVARGWNINTITEFLSHARRLGYEIEEVPA